MPSVLFWYGEHGGTAQYRAFNPGRALARVGWDVAFEGEGIYVNSEGCIKGDPDVLVMVRAMGGWIPDIVRLIKQHGRTTVVYDADDWFLNIPAYNPAAEILAGDIDSMHEAMRLADLVTCSTPELVEGYGDLNPNTVLLPNCLDPDIWNWDENRRYRTPHVKIRVGWLGAFHWRAGDLDLLKPWVPQFLADHPECEFYAPGAPELLDYLGIEGLTTPAVPSKRQRSERTTFLRPYEHLPAMLGHLDIGLVPLIHNRFNQAKSHIKGLEYNAMGVPAVASASREYRSFIRPGVNGELVRHNNWREKVERVLADLDNYRDGARKVAAEYMIDDHIDRWVDAYTSARSAAA